MENKIRTIQAKYFYTGNEERFEQSIKELSELFERECQSLLSQANAELETRGCQIDVLLKKLKNHRENVGKYQEEIQWWGEQCHILKDEIAELKAKLGEK